MKEKVMKGKTILEIINKTKITTHTIASNCPKNQFICEYFFGSECLNPCFQQEDGEVIECEY